MFAFFAFFLVYTVTATAEEAAFWPKLVCTVGMALSAVNVAIYGTKWMKEKDSLPVFPLTGAQTVRALLLTVIMMVWVFCLEKLGFLTASVLSVLVIILIFEPVKDKKHIIRDVIAGIIFSFILYELFTLLGVHFPAGILM